MQAAKKWLAASGKSTAVVREMTLRDCVAIVRLQLPGKHRLSRQGECSEGAASFGLHGVQDTSFLVALWRLGRRNRNANRE